MKHRLIIHVVIAALALGGAAACGGNPEPEGPTPEELERMRQDSIAAANRARQDSIAAAEAAARQAEAEARRRAEAETAAARQIIEEMIHFGYDQSVITPEAEQKLMQKLGIMRANPDLQIRIAGHADERGSVEYNRALGQRRAEAARDFLVGFGISQGRITTVSFGEDRPMVSGTGESVWAQNRRDEFSIMSGGDQLRNPSGP